MKTSRKAGLKDILADIPLAHAMRIHVVEHSQNRLVLAAPETPSLNHIGIAFGGAIECLGTLAGWGLLWLTLNDPNLRIVIQHAETTFRAPLEGDLRAEAELPGQDDWTRFHARLAERGRARLEIKARIGDANHPEGARFSGRYAVAHDKPG